MELGATKIRSRSRSPHLCPKPDQIPSVLQSWICEPIPEIHACDPSAPVLARHQAGPEIFASGFEISGFRTTSLNVSYGLNLAACIGGKPTYWDLATLLFMYFQMEEQRWAICPIQDEGEDVFSSVVQGRPRGIAFQEKTGQWSEFSEGAWVQTTVTFHPAVSSVACLSAWPDTLPLAAVTCRSSLAEHQELMSLSGLAPESSSGVQRVLLWHRGPETKIALQLGQGSWAALLLPEELHREQEQLAVRRQAVEIICQSLMRSARQFDDKENTSIAENTETAASLKQKPSNTPRKAQKSSATAAATSIEAALAFRYRGALCPGYRRHVRMLKMNLAAKGNDELRAEILQGVLLAQHLATRSSEELAPSALRQHREEIQREALRQVVLPTDETVAIAPRPDMSPLAKLRIR
mmetsp:Transcript_89849/g.159840  ORF Transcript_89849/g.159840 Transcript_89849/m.159840 type:complete len:409 (+) Transcript_89849:30-1256(+)|eukprot:CAMPEP_0197660824 /NCGR_PEP_ID=MMETSP1338-20131121/51082_1 /TAXON_ID=43686 ORGANISM="Pelagodinium beii, Strain RCC1491" /NCGR_SAMPLE_ID=MMETSP1338 /ASSEMBLY_ACC=CAM_ASM_000754 /LENGTH=408 /DNA_ID=CAMNT_0043238257 /DNA_START=30 /DNA_END=1256 /DNA_ORIENTATION=-